MRSDIAVTGISTIDWAVIAFYLVGIVALGLWLARKTKSGDDYFLAGRNVPALIAAMSIMATQTSTISLIGAPAFVAAQANGGLRWLQYEMALPLAMIAIMVLFVPMLWRSGVVTVYEFLERRFGLGARLILSAVFLISRALATGVMVYATAVVLAVATGAPIWALVAIIAAVCLVYSTLGGFVADVWTDAVQLVILFGGVLVSIVYVVVSLGSVAPVMSLAPERAQALVFSAHGLGDGETFGFWPLLIGGVFLYMAYYGTDQTQVQRVLAAPSVSSGRKSLFLNGMMRFPLVLTYCVLGVVLAALLRHDAAFADAVEAHADINYLVPIFIVSYLPPGLVGVLLAGMMAATMSSLDSTFNSLSAATMRDFVERFGLVEDSSSRKYVFTARAVTFFWGVLCSAFAFVVGDISPTVIESINKIGSVFYGPVLAVFVLAFVTRRVTGTSAIIGLVAGVGLNVMLWVDFPGVSWLWWNLFGFLVTLVFALALSLPELRPPRARGSELPRRRGLYVVAIAGVTGFWAYIVLYGIDWDLLQLGGTGSLGQMLPYAAALFLVPGVAFVQSVPMMTPRAAAELGVERRVAADASPGDTRRYFILAVYAGAIVLISWLAGVVFSS